MTQLFSPPRSKVTPDELYKEVGEYFDLGLSIEPGDTVLDVGANIGAFALRAAEATKGKLRILAFEPSPETFMALAANFESNDTLKKTDHHLFHLGLSSREDTLEFYDFARFPTNSTFDLAGKRREFEIFFEDRGRRAAKAVPGIGHVAGAVFARLPKAPGFWSVTRQIMGVRTHTIPVSTLARVLEGERVDRIDLLKIDVEGPELDVLRGIDDATWKKVRQVVLETHDRDGRLGEIKTLLERHGLREMRQELQKTIDNGLESIVLYAHR
jgi:FkbM family methyltransferase